MSFKSSFFQRSHRIALGVRHRNTKYLPGGGGCRLINAESLGPPVIGDANLAVPVLLAEDCQLGALTESENFNRFERRKAPITG